MIVHPTAMPPLRGYSRGYPQGHRGPSDRSSSSNISPEPVSPRVQLSAHEAAEQFRQQIHLQWKRRYVKNVQRFMTRRLMLRLEPGFLT